MGQALTWAERIQAARERGFKRYGVIGQIKGVFTTEDIALAGDFAACAVGELAPDKPRGWRTPFWPLGMQFYDAVLHRDVEAAESVYKKIAKEAAKS